MTPNMGMAAPKGTQAPQAGLAALAQPAQAPKGKSPENMGEIMALARRMSDAQLADVLQGKSLDVPQFAAMTEAMGRRQLRTAMQGAQAMGQMRQPSVKDKLLAEETAAQMPQMPQMAPAPQAMPAPVMAAGGGLMYDAGGAIDMNEDAGAGGIANLPAPNMMPMTMADGGIVAFADTKPGTETEMPIREELTEEEKKQLAENPYMQRVQGVKNLGSAFFTPRNYDPLAKGSDLISSIQNWGKDTAGANAAWEAGRKQRTGETKIFTDEQTPKGKMVDAGLASPNTPIPALEKTVQANLDKQSAPTAADKEDAAAGTGMMALMKSKQNQAPAAVAEDKASSQRRATLAGTDTTGGFGLNPEKRANPFGELSAELPDYAKVKSQGLGEGLMLLSSAMFGTPNLQQAFSKGLPLLASVSGATRKELAELKKDYNAQQLNLAKANELFEQGQEDKAYKYFKQSQDHAVELQKAMAAMAAAGKPSDTVQTLNAIRKPGESMSDAYARLSSMKQDPKTDQALQLKYADYMKSAAGMLNPMKYDQWLTVNGFGGGQQVAAAGNTGYSAIYGANGQRIQ